ALACECSDSLSRVEVSDVEVTCPPRDLVAPPSGVVHLVLTPDPLIEEPIDERTTTERCWPRKLLSHVEHPSVAGLGSGEQSFASGSRHVRLDTPQERG